LKQDGYAVVQLLGVKYLRTSPEVVRWYLEVEQQVNRFIGHWHHYYSSEELEHVFLATGFGHSDVRDGEPLWSLVKPSKLSVPDDFDRSTYLALNLDVARAGADPETHWLEYGHRENRRWR